MCKKKKLVPWARKLSDTYQEKHRQLQSTTSRRPAQSRSEGFLSQQQPHSSTRNRGRCWRGLKSKDSFRLVPSLPRESASSQFRPMPRVWGTSGSSSILGTLDAYFGCRLGIQGKQSAQRPSNQRPAKSPKHEAVRRLDGQSCDLGILSRDFGRLRPWRLCAPPKSQSRSGNKTQEPSIPKVNRPNRTEHRIPRVASNHSDK